MSDVHAQDRFCAPQNWFFEKFWYPVSGTILVPSFGDALLSQVMGPSFGHQNGPQNGDVFLAKNQANWRNIFAHKRSLGSRFLAVVGVLVQAGGGAWKTPLLANLNGTFVPVAFHVRRPSDCFGSSPAMAAEHTFRRNVRDILHSSM